jgi:L-amino acid N-acyltransferase YncA
MNQRLAKPRLRQAAPADADAIASIYREAVLHGTATFELEPPEAAEMSRRMADLAAGGFPWLVAECDGRLVGYAYAALYRERPAYRWTVEDSIYIAGDMHGRGIGRALLDALVRESEERGYRQMIAVIGDAASAGSIALHRACGFRHVGVFEAVGRKHGKWLDTVLMQRGLGGGAQTAPDQDS